MEQEVAMPTNNFFDLTDDLTVGQFQDLLQYLWARQKGIVSRANIKGWTISK
jgi:hypothetical protein